MSTLTFRTLNRTPFRDLVRGRVTGRLDWAGHLAAAGLSPEATAVVRAVVRRTWLRRLERAAVADDLIAHFHDAADAGTPPAAAVEAFGDPRTAAALIARAKRRERSPLARTVVWFRRAAAAAVVAYLVLLARFAVGRPTPRVDYLARLAAPAERVPEGDRAWPLYQAAERQLLAVNPSVPVGTGRNQYGRILAGACLGRTAG